MLEPFPYSRGVAIHVGVEGVSSFAPAHMRAFQLKKIMAGAFGVHHFDLAALCPFVELDATYECKTCYSSETLHDVQDPQPSYETAQLARPGDECQHSQFQRTSRVKAALCLHIPAGSSDGRMLKCRCSTGWCLPEPSVLADRP